MQLAQGTQLLELVLAARLAQGTQLPELVLAARLAQGTQFQGDFSLEGSRAGRTLHDR